MRGLTPLSPDATALFSARADERLLLAVSGGADSIALLGLAAKSRPSALTHCATIDHQLRPGSSDEARLVEDVCRRLGIPHTTIVWSGEKPTTGLQAAAREARYHLLAKQARAVGAATVVTAHSRDDQAETLLMRLAHGSGIDGLAGMARETIVHGLTLWRPFLDLSRATLRATAIALELPFIDDPSNDNLAFERVRWRAEIARGLFEADRLATVARRAGEASEALAFVANDLAMRHGREGILDYAALADLPVDLRRRVFARFIAKAGGEADRLERLEQLIDRLDAAHTSGKAFQASLGGTVLRLGQDGNLTIRPEIGRRRNRAKTA